MCSSTYLPPLQPQNLTCHISKFQEVEMALQPISSGWHTASQDGEELLMFLMDHVHPTRAPLKRVQSGQQCSVWTICLTYYSCQQIRGSLDRLFVHSTSWDGRDATALHCKRIKQSWIVREPGGSIMLKHTWPGRSEDCSWWFQGGVMFNVYELEGQVSHAYDLKQGRSKDESWGIPKRGEVQVHKFR